MGFLIYWVTLRSKAFGNSSQEVEFVHRLTRGLSVSLVLGLTASIFAVSPASAAEEARVDVKSGGGAYFTITNVVDEKPAVPLYITEAPATVTFHGDNLSMEDIDYYSEGELVGEDSIMLNNFGGYVLFDVKNYTYIGETEVHDELTEEMVDLGVYVTGNYATLTIPGFYLVAVGPEAVDPTRVVIQVMAQSAVEPEATVTPEPVSAVPTRSRVMVNDTEVAFGAYNINGNNYFKLRDLAMALSGSEKQFQVIWDSEYNAINLISGRPYTPVGGELAVSSAPAAQQALPTASKVFVNGEQVQLTAYNIGGNNYFKLRDIARVIDFGVTWDASTSTIGIDSASAYTE